MVWRRMFLRATLGGTAACSLLSVLTPAVRGAASIARGSAARTILFNDGWLFGPASASSDLPGFDDSAFATVTLPHTVASLSWQNWDPSGWEQVWVYRKHFDAPSGTDGMRVFLDFSAAMTHSTVTLNGVEVADYLGGYLPFSAEITRALLPSGNVLAVTLDSTFNLDVPPDRPAPYLSTSVDFWQPGGIYRDVRLRTVPPVFVTDVFAQPVNVLDPAVRQVVVQATVDAALVLPGTVQVAVELLDGRTVASGQVPVTITGAGQVTVTATLSELGDITLWDIGNPKLYQVVATLLVNGSPLHDYRVRIGFREATFSTRRVLPQRPPGQAVRGRPAPVLPVRGRGDARPGAGQGRRDHPVRAELQHGALLALPAVGGLLRRLR